MNTKIEKEILDEMSKNPNNWRGVFYFNPKDYRIIVPKLNPSLGWTLNFASPYTYVFLVAFIIIVVSTNFL